MTPRFRVVRPAGVPAGAAAASLAGLGGCGGGGQGAAPAANSAPTWAPAATSPAELEGSWTRRFTRREVEPDGSPAGRYTLEIADGIAHVYAGPDADPAKDCMTHSFAVSGDTLRTRKVERDCLAGRTVLFDGRTWRRAS